MTAFLLSLLLSFPGKFYDSHWSNCYDGDTCTFDIVVSDDNRDLPFDLNERTIITKINQRVRLCDINAPEIKGPNSIAALTARDDLVRWIKSAKKLELYIAQRSICTDTGCDKTEKYGRLLGWIIADGVNLNALQIQRGNAVEFIQCPR